MPRVRLTKQASQAEVVTIATFNLGGATKVIDTEDVAVEAHRIAPSRFSWRKYPDQVNLELVRVFLSDGKKAGRGWLEGSGKTGWSLTPAGLDWARANAEKILGTDQAKKRSELRSGSIDERRWRRERTRIVSLAAWREWSAGRRKVDPSEASEVFRIDSYAVGRMRSRKVSRLLEMFETDTEIRPFLEAAAKALPIKEN